MEEFDIGMQTASHLPMWLDVFIGTEAKLPVDTALQMLDAVNLYAMQCVGVTEAHAAAIRAKKKIETVDAYDFTVGYPEKLSF